MVSLRRTTELLQHIVVLTLDSVWPDVVMNVLNGLVLHTRTATAALRPGSSFITTKKTFVMIMPRVLIRMEATLVLATMVTVVTALHAKMRMNVPMVPTNVIITPRAQTPSEATLVLATLVTAVTASPVWIITNAIWAPTAVTAMLNVSTLTVLTRASAILVSAATVSLAKMMMNVLMVPTHATLTVPLAPILLAATLVLARMDTVATG